KHFKIGNRYTVRACFYYDVANNGINDNTQMVIDMVIVLLDDGEAWLQAIFPQTEYEGIYKNAIETTLSSVKVNASKTPSSSASSGTPGQAVKWVDFLKEYEAWVDDCIRLIEKYKTNPVDLSLMMDYLDMMQRMAEWAEKADKVKADLSGNDLKEYLATYMRIITKLNAAIVRLK
ncbi:MAG: hypothetical protein FWG09_07395, partial [Synergistaceae bacterium]|nr:hypothetical protein [Synergistaceae bacterium]